MARKKGETAEIVRGQPSTGLAPWQEMENWFDEMFSRHFSLLRSPSWPRPTWPRTRWRGLEEMTPSVDLYEEGDNLVLEAELPGMSKKDIELTLSDQTLTLAGEKRQEKETKEKDYHRSECSYGSFRRSFRLPDGVDLGKADAKFQDGVLKVTLPKTAGAKEKTRKINVQ
jgi:HSP20 family protein